MRKFRLQLEDLQVDSFDTQEVEAERGTVRAHADTEDQYCTFSCATCGPWTKCDCPPNTIVTGDGSDSHMYVDTACW